MKRLVLSLAAFCAFNAGASSVGRGCDAAGEGCWYYGPYEYEAWMLQRMKKEADRGVLYFGYPGKFLSLGEEPEAVWSTTPISGLEPIRGVRGVPPHRSELPLTEMPLKSAGGCYDLGHEDIGYVYVFGDDAIPTGRQGVIEVDVGKGLVRKFIK